MTRYGASPIAPSRTTRHAKTCKPKVPLRWKAKINYAGYAALTVAADGNLWTTTACVAVAARLLAADRCRLWAGRAGTAHYGLFARHRTARPRPPIGTTHMNAELRQNSPPRSFNDHTLSASNTRDMFWDAINRRRTGCGNSDTRFSVIYVCRFRDALTYLAYLSVR